MRVGGGGLRKALLMSSKTAGQCPPDTRVFPIAVDLPEGSIEAEVVLPARRVRLVVLAFKMLSLSSIVADMAARGVEALGHKVTCQAGCGACCRQLVPLSPPEAAMIYEFVTSMPEARRASVRKRFAEMKQSLRHQGLLGRLEHLIRRPETSKGQYQQVAAAYFERQLPCPFLVDESCSIYEVRPSMCREYLVTSPAESCGHPEKGSIKRVPVSVRLSEVLVRTWATFSGQKIRVVPLSLALTWTEKNQDTRRIQADSQTALAVFLDHIAHVAAGARGRPVAP